MRIIKTIPALALVTSLASVALLLAATEGAVAKNSNNHKGALELREVHHDHDHDGKHDHDHNHNHKHKDHDGKGKGKADNKCGGKKKCPTPIVKPIHHPGGGPGPGPLPGTGPTIGKGLGDIGKLPGGPALGDPGYSAPPAAGLPGGAGPSRDPVENGSGTTLKPN